MCSSLHTEKDESRPLVQKEALGFWMELKGSRWRHIVRKSQLELDAL
jgi:hypothetical protein